MKITAEKIKLQDKVNKVLFMIALACMLVTLMM